jgi:hypothetical protein
MRIRGKWNNMQQILQEAQIACAHIGLFQEQQGLEGTANIW